MSYRQVLNLLQVLTTLCAIATCVIEIIWPFPVFPFAACMFTWQATVVWCRKRYLIDGRNVWERKPHNL